MNTIYIQSTTPLVSEAPIVSEATFEQKVRPSKEIPSPSLPQALKPQKKISKNKRNSKRRKRLSEVIHFDSDEEEELDLDWGKIFMHENLGMINVINIFL